ALARYNVDGTLDLSFDNDGKLTTDFGGSYDYANSVAIDSLGRIVVAGQSYNVTASGTGYDFGLARYNVDGTLDLSFDNDGKLTTDFGRSDDIANSVAIDSLGRIVVAGRSNTDFALARYNLDGTLDPMFDHDGTLTIDIGFNNDAANSVAIDREGRIVVAGKSNDDFALARIDNTATTPLQTVSGLRATFANRGVGAGSLVRGPQDVFQGVNRLQVAGSVFAPVGGSSPDDSGQTLVTSSAVMDGLTVHRDVTVPNTGTVDFVRTLDVFANPSANPITTTVRMTGNLGSDAATTVFMTSDGDTIVEPTDLWFGTDDGDGSGTPAVIHFLHGPGGLQPTSVNVIEDNVEWTYDLTVPAGQTSRLATFTVLGTTRAQAIAAANVLVASTGFGGQAAAFLDAGELTSISNFGFNTAPTDLTLSSSTVAENGGANALVGILSTTDPDAGDTFTYSLVTGTGSTDNAAFRINGNRLEALASFNFEARSSYSVRIRTTDAGGLSFDKQFTISVTDVNETPTDISLSHNSLAENAGANAVIGTLSGTDPDTGDTLTFSLAAGLGDNAAFNVSGTSLRANASFDFEMKNSYSVTVRVTDAGGLSFDKQFTISVTDVNENPTAISLSNALVKENLPAGTTVGTLSASDPDAGETISYSLVSGTGSTDNGSFTISGSTLKTAATFNYELKNSYSIRVRATDHAGLTVDQVFTISVQDVTELGGIDVQLGQTQRSYVRYLDVLFDRPDDIMSMVNSGRFQLTKKDLNGQIPQNVPLTASMFSLVGSRARVDFGSNGLGGNRNTTAGDGYYQLGIDMD
ncbi:MAG: cadherin domain-containing protein, partial [Planctomycetaceae bacterium]|nr:cadherin domain-containing protein [Planctomycetaceae bacterium]